MILGAAVFVVQFVMAPFLIGHPEKIGLHPDGRAHEPKSSSGGIGRETIYEEITYSVAEAIHTRSFWVLTAVFFCSWIFVFLPLVHLVIFALDIGLSQKSAFIALGTLGGGSMIGRLSMGFLSDRIGRKPALAINLGLQVFCWFWIMGTRSSWMLFLFTAVFGFSYGGVSALFPAIIGDYFGRLQAASVIGAVFTIAGVASAIGPLVAGYIYDLSRSYQPAFLLGALTNFLALILLFFSKPPLKEVRRVEFGVRSREGMDKSAE
jgi:MFS family permease